MFSLVVSEKSAIGLEVNSESQALWWVTEKKTGREAGPLSRV
jgi:hypothetical protein